MKTFTPRPSLPQTMVEDQELWERARKRAAEKSAFYYHLVAYAVLNSFLIFLWWFTSGVGSNPWFVWVVVGWGIGLAFHGAYVFVGEGYIRRQTRREYERLRSRE